MGLAVLSTSASRSASLVPVLPTEPVTPITLACVRARAAAARSRKAGEHVGHDEQRRILRQLATPLGGNDRKPGLRRQRRGDEVVAVAVVAVMAKNASPGAMRAAVDRNPGYRLRQRALRVRRPSPAAIASTVHSARALMRQAP